MSEREGTDDPPGSEFLSDAPFFGLSLWTQFELALCALLNLEANLEMALFGVSNVFEAARHMSETVEAFTRQVLLQFV